MLADIFAKANECSECTVSDLLVARIPVMDLTRPKPSTSYPNGRSEALTVRLRASIMHRTLTSLETLPALKRKLALDG